MQHSLHTLIETASEEVVGNKAGEIIFYVFENNTYISMQ